MVSSRLFGNRWLMSASVKSRSVLKMIEVGGNVYYLAKLAGIFGLNVQDIGRISGNKRLHPGGTRRDSGHC